MVGFRALNRERLSRVGMLERRLWSAGVPGATEL